MSGLTAGLRHTPPYDKTYMTTIDSEFAGMTVLDFYCKRFRFLTRLQWENVIASGDTTVNGLQPSADQVLCLKDLLCTHRSGVVEPPVHDHIEVLHDADGLFVINKPSPLPVHPSGRYWKNTLTEILAERDPARRYHPIYRLDAWTTGVLIMATTPAAATILHRQVMRQQMQKTYAVLACGLDLNNLSRSGDEMPATSHFTVDVPIGRIPGGVRSTHFAATDSKPARTEFTILARSGEVTLLKAVPITGRTNQIRVHLQHIGAHVLNDPLYSPVELKKSTLDDAATFMGLHCREMRFEWPLGKPCIMRAPWPEEYLQHFNRRFLDEKFNKICHINT